MAGVPGPTMGRMWVRRQRIEMVRPSSARRSSISVRHRARRLTRRVTGWPSRMVGWPGRIAGSRGRPWPELSTRWGGRVARTLRPWILGPSHGTDGSLSMLVGILQPASLPGVCVSAARATVVRLRRGGPRHVLPVRIPPRVVHAGIGIWLSVASLVKGDRRPLRGSSASSAGAGRPDAKGTSRAICSGALGRFGVVAMMGGPLTRPYHHVVFWVWSC